MKKNLFSLAILMLTVLSSCEFKCNVGKTDDSTTKSTSKIEGKTETGSTDDPNKPQLLHNISLQEKGGVKVFRAFLQDQAGDMIRDNTTAMGQPIFLNINVTSGWEIVDGKTYLGATQRISTDNGTEILKTSDLFSDYDTTGFNAEDAKILSLKSRITEAKGPIEHYVVEFRLWDKKGPGEITGSYKFKVKE